MALRANTRGTSASLHRPILGFDEDSDKAGKLSRRRPWTRPLGRRTKVLGLVIIAGVLLAVSPLHCSKDLRLAGREHSPDLFASLFVCGTFEE